MGIGHLAELAAYESDFTKYRVGAVVRNRTFTAVSWGTNKRKTHPAQSRHAKKVGMPDRQFLHAEIDAIVKFRGTPYSIEVCRITKKGNYGMARPCPICYRAIQEAGIKWIYYTDGKGNSIKEKVEGN